MTSERQLWPFRCSHVSVVTYEGWKLVAGHIGAGTHAHNPGLTDGAECCSDIAELPDLACATVMISCLPGVVNTCAGE